MERFEVYAQKIVEMIIDYGSKIILALILFMIGLKVIKAIVKIIFTLMEKRKFDPTLAPFLTNIVGWGLKGLLFISLAAMLGIETTSFVAILGAAGLAVGLALQGSLANFAGGVLILMFRPFVVNDFIQAQGHEGFVTSIDMFATVIRTYDYRKVVLPNGPLASGAIKNFTSHQVRRVDLTIGISYNDDIKLACKVLKEMCYLNPKVLKDPEVFVAVNGYGDSSINLVIRPWCKTPDYWGVYYELNEAIKYTLDQNKISIPFPQRDVHIFNQKS